MRGGDAAHLPGKAAAKTDHMSASPHFLCSNAFLCFAGSYCVILDVKQDRYFCIESSAFNDLKPWLRSGSDCPECLNYLKTPTQNTSASVAPLARDLVTRGLLTEERTDANEHLVPHFECANASLVSPGPSKGNWSSLARLHKFSTACTRAHRALQHHRFEDTIKRVRSRTEAGKFRHIVFDLHKAKRLVRDFLSLRPLFPRKYLCLFDSLALLEFLSMYGLHPSWVFGVQPDPFEAHCWLQYENVVLNDTMEVVSMYTPIMTV